MYIYIYTHIYRFLLYFWYYILLCFSYLLHIKCLLKLLYGLYPEHPVAVLPRSIVADAKRPVQPGDREDANGPLQYIYILYIYICVRLLGYILVPWIPPWGI